MTVSADHITADLKVRFDRKPTAREEWDLINEMKSKYNFKWTGYAESGCWTTDKYAFTPPAAGARDCSRLSAPGAHQRPDGGA